MSIRTRLALAVALVLAVTLTILGATIVGTTRATLIAQVDDQVFGLASRAGGHGGPGGDGDDHNGSPTFKTTTPPPADENDLIQRPVALFVYDANGVQKQNEQSGFSDEPNAPPALPPIPSSDLDALVGRIVTLPAVDGSLSYRALVQRGPGGYTIVTAAPLTDADAAVDRLMRILTGVGLGAMVAATFASWWLIGRGLRPVDRMVDTAAAIAAGDLSRRVPDADPRTELGRLGGALNDMLHQIEQAARTREATEARLRRFVADAAHELRTPLTSLRGYAELYRQGALADAAGVENAMRRIEAEGARMARLVDDLLLLARLDQQRGLETRRVDLVPLVRDAVADFAVAAPGHPISNDLAEEAIVRGDPARLRQVIDNLLSNARTHTPPGTPVRVAVRRAGDAAEIVVADEGPGIPAESQARVYERFWRSDPGRGRGTGGTGLGLAIVASLVAAHGGSVDLRSEPGRGTTFTVRLPLANADASSMAVAVVRHQPPSSREDAGSTPASERQPAASPRDPSPAPQ